MKIPKVRLTTRKENKIGEFIDNPGGSYDYLIYGNSVASKLALVEDILDKVLWEDIDNISNQAEKALKVLELFQPLIDSVVETQKEVEEYEAACVLNKIGENYDT